MSDDSVALRVWGDLALFTRPELKVERVSYPMMTPSAARGVFDAILFRPQMLWHIRRIHVLEPQFPVDFPESGRQLPFRLTPIRRNEIQDKISTRNVQGWMKTPETVQPYLVDSAGREGAQGEHRTQRNSLVLQYVSYLIEATPRLTQRANQPRIRPEDDEDHGPDTVAKYVAMFRRRAGKGQCFHRPYLGCREFACQFALPDGTERTVDWTTNLGMMLYDIRFGTDGKHRPGFFDAQVNRGILHCDTLKAGLNGEAPVHVFGWDTGETT